MLPANLLGGRLADSPYTANRIPSSHRGRINGVNAVSQAMLIALCQLAVGQIYERTGAGPAWTLVFVLGAVLILLILVLGRKDRKAFPKLYS